MSFLTLKIVGCLIIISVSSLSGFLKSYGLYRRRDFLKSFIVFLDSLATHIRYNSSDVFALVRMSVPDELSEIFNNSIKETNKPFPLCWSEMSKSIPKSYSLTDGDRQVILNFGEKLGVTDVDGEIQHIKLYKSLAIKQLSDAEDNIAKKSKLYKTMGFFIGTAAALMLI